MNNYFLFSFGLFVAILAIVGVFAKKDNSETERFSGVDPRNNR